MVLPRHAFSPRDAARAGDVWRAFQEAAVEASTLAGWPPLRYREVGTAFVVRAMTVHHHREAAYGERFTARTWVHGFKRGIISTREVRFVGEAGPIASATQDWVHVDATLKPARAPDALVECFPPHEEDAPVHLPAWADKPGKTHLFHFEPWHVWMDPLAHVNHPAYVDFCDENVSRVMAAHGLSPVALCPVAEKMTFRAGVAAGDRVTVESRLAGVTGEGALVLAHRVSTEDGTLCADGLTVRRLAGADTARLMSIWEE